MLEETVPLPYKSLGVIVDMHPQLPFFNHVTTHTIILHLQMFPLSCANIFLQESSPLGCYQFLSMEDYVASSVIFIKNIVSQMSAFCFLSHAHCSYRYVDECIQFPFAFFYFVVICISCFTCKPCQLCDKYTWILSQIMQLKRKTFTPFFENCYTSTNMFCNIQVEKAQSSKT